MTVDAWPTFSDGVSRPYRIPCGILGEKVGGDLTDFPHRWKMPWSSFGPDAVDLTSYRGANSPAFYSAAGALLDFENDVWLGGEGDTTNYWVEDDLTAGSNVGGHYLYFGPTNLAASLANATGTWDASHKGVWHCGDATFAIRDSTSTPATGIAGAGVGLQQTGQIGKSIDCDDADGTGSVNLGTDSKLNLTQATGLTMSAWVKPDGASEDGFIFSRFDSANSGYSLNWVGSIDRIRIIYGTGVGTTQKLSDTVFVDDGSAWVHVAVAINTDGTLTFYRNGVAAGTGSGVSITGDAADSAYIGDRGGTGQGATTRFDGGVDEVRVSATARSADWILAEYLAGKNLLGTLGPVEVKMAGVVRRFNPRLAMPGFNPRLYM